MGMIWIVVCEFYEDLYLDEEYRHTYNQLGEEYFLSKFGIIDMSLKESVIVAMYFAFTTLSTVGFGDFYPCSDFERAIGAAILFFGVIMFSYIMGYFIEKMENFRALNKDFNEDQALQKFLKTLWHLNKRIPIDREF